VLSDPGLTGLTRGLGLQGLHGDWAYRAYTGTGLTGLARGLGLQGLHGDWAYRAYMGTGLTGLTGTVGLNLCVRATVQIP
jgi:hypothetical protein